MNDSAQIDENLGGKLLVQKMLLWNENTLKCSELCCWIHYDESWQKLLLNVFIKEINMSLSLKDIFFLSCLMRAVSPVPDLWLFFEDCFKRSNKAGSGDFYKYSMESIKGILMMVCYKDHKPDS